MCMVKGKGAHDWEEISTTVGRRSAKHCRERWHQNINPQLNRSPITRQEGDCLLNWVAQKDMHWAEITRHLERGRLGVRSSPRTGSLVLWESDHAKIKSRKVPLLSTDKPLISRESLILRSPRPLDQSQKQTLHTCIWRLVPWVLLSEVRNRGVIRE